MAGTYTSRGNLYKTQANGDDNVDPVLDLNNNWDRIDALLGWRPVTSGTVPASAFQGAPFFRTDTGKFYINSGAGGSAALALVQVMTSGSSFDSSLTIAGSGFYTGEIRSTQATTAGRAFVARLAADTDDRWRVDQDGATAWGDGTNPTDVSMERSAAGELTANGDLVVTGDLAVGGATTVDDVTVNGRLSIGGAIYRPAGGGTQVVSNTATETVVATCTIPADDVTPGAVFRLRVTGVASVTGTPSFTMRVRIGGLAGTQVNTSGAITASSGVQNKPIELEALFTILAIGSSGLTRGWMKVTETLSLAGSNPPTTSSVVRQDISLADIGMNTTISRDLVVTVQWGTASASNGYVAINKVLERVA